MNKAQKIDKLDIAISQRLGLMPGQFSLVHNNGRLRLLECPLEQPKNTSQDDTFQLLQHYDLNVYSFADSGRLCSWVKDGVRYRLGISGQLLAIYTYQLPSQLLGNTNVALPKQLTFPKEIPQSAAPYLFKQIRNTIEKAGNYLHNPKKLDKVNNYNWEQLHSEFSKVWKPISILPPEAYTSVVLQLTEGCSYNNCAFCTFYKGVKYRVKGKEEFEKHCMDVCKFLGSELYDCNSVFLADANAANVPNNALFPALESLNSLRKKYPKAKCFSQVSSFLDIFSCAGRTLKEWQKARNLGLRNLFLGVESGSDNVLQMMRKPYRSSSLIPLVEKLKAAGLNLGLIVMSGFGSVDKADEHIEETLSLLNSLPLDGKDICYISKYYPCQNISPQNNHNNSQPFFKPTKEIFVEEALREIRNTREYNAIADQLHFSPYPKGPQICPYDVKQFVY